MSKKKKPFQFGARIGGKPFKVQIDLKQGHIVNGLYDDDYFYRFTRPVPVVKGDVFSAAPGKGLILNGKLILRNIVKPKDKTAIKIGWAPEKMRVAVFYEREGKAPPWVAVDTRGYWIGVGSSPQEALKRLVEIVRFTDEAEQEEIQNGHRVIRWHVERTPGTKKELLNMEKKAKKTGFILDGVEWRKAEFAKKLAK